MKTKIPVSLLLMQAAVFAATKAEEGNIISQITGGFSGIIAGSLGLKIAIAIIAVIGIGIGFWRGSAGIW